MLTRRMTAPGAQYAWFCMLLATNDLNRFCRVLRNEYPVDDISEHQAEVIA
jgi:hypothetical protein